VVEEPTMEVVEEVDGACKSVELATGGGRDHADVTVPVVDEEAECGKSGLLARGNKGDSDGESLFADDGVRVCCRGVMSGE